MENFIKNFVRYSDGSWLCIRPGYYQGPPFIAVTVGARFTPGTVVEDTEVTRLLDQEFQRQQSLPRA